MKPENQPLHTDELRMRAEAAFLEKKALSLEGLDALSHDEVKQMLHELRAQDRTGDAER